MAYVTTVRYSHIKDSVRRKYDINYIQDAATRFTVISFWCIYAALEINLIWINHTRDRHTRFVRVTVTLASPMKVLFSSHLECADEKCIFSECRVLWVMTIDSAQMKWRPFQSIKHKRRERERERQRCYSRLLLNYNWLHWINLSSLFNSHQLYFICIVVWLTNESHSWDVFAYVAVSLSLLPHKLTSIASCRLVWTVTPVIANLITTHG